MGYCVASGLINSLKTERGLGPNHRFAEDLGPVREMKSLKEQVVDLREENVSLEEELLALKEM